MLPRIKYPRETVAASIDRMASDIHVSDNTVILVLMSGGLWFAHELIRRLSIVPPMVEYIKVRSYKGQKRCGLQMVYLPDVALEDKDVIVLDDICDSGATLNALAAWLEPFEPASVQFLTLIAREGFQLNEGLCFKTCLLDDSRDFFVGCGMDDNGAYRYLPYIGVVNP